MAAREGENFILARFVYFFFKKNVDKIETIGSIAAEFPTQIGRLNQIASITKVAQFICGRIQAY